MTEEGNSTFSGAESGAKPVVRVVAMGGTIASRGANSLVLTDYGEQSGNRPEGISELLRAVPEALHFARVSGLQLNSGGSSAITIPELLSLARILMEELAKPEVAGVVVTHGTDTLEETAYFLSLVLPPGKPVVVTGAMRPATGLSADGPLNLVNAIALAASPEARDRGVMVCFDDEILPPLDATKTHTTSVETFRAPDTGPIGVTRDFSPVFFSDPPRYFPPRFSLGTLPDLPKVGIVYTAIGMGGEIVDLLVNAGCRGIVAAGMGHASLPPVVRNRLRAAAASGIPVVCASRTGSGLVTPRTLLREAGFVPAYLHNPQKARILLMLCLATGLRDPVVIEDMFRKC